MERFLILPVFVCCFQVALGDFGFRPPGQFEPKIPKFWQKEIDATESNNFLDAFSKENDQFTQMIPHRFFEDKKEITNHSLRQKMIIPKSSLNESKIKPLSLSPSQNIDLEFTNQYFEKEHEHFLNDLYHLNEIEKLNKKSEE
jgi:hypothetical protein